jgi:hypothetical protein
MSPHGHTTLVALVARKKLHAGRFVPFGGVAVRHRGILLFG